MGGERHNAMHHSLAGDLIDFHFDEETSEINAHH